MKTLMIAALILAPLAAQPAMAASLEDHPSIDQHRLAAFAGARLRIAVGGERAGQARLGLAMTGLDYRRSAGGSVATRFAEGTEYDFSAEHGFALSFAGQPVRLGKDRLNASEGGISPKLIIGVGVAIIAAGAAAGVISALDD